MINRRQFGRILKGAGAGLMFPGAILAANAQSDGSIELRAVKTSKKLVPGDYAPSDLWTYNGTSPGPEIRVKRGERVKVHFINELDEPTSIHWHGIRIDNAMDGVSGLTQQPVPPGGSFDYDFVAPDAGTFWYHAHNNSWEQVARGLYGPLIVDEARPPFDRDHDITLVFDDWRVGKDGALQVASLGAFMDWTHGGRLGNYLTVNGAPPQQTLTLNAGEAYRLRLINAANARVLEFDPNRIGASVIAYDGQSLSAPHMLTFEPMLLAPAQRVDLLVIPKPDGENHFALEELSGNEAFDVVRFEVKQTGRPAAPVPVLQPNDLPRPDLTNAQVVPLLMQGGAMGQMGKVVYNGRELSRGDFAETKQVWTFNGIANLAQQPLFRARRGETIVIDTDNKTAFLHGMHVHGHHFQVISRSGSTIDEQPWRDTFAIGPDQMTRIAFVADNPGKWLLHCHMLEHAAAGMQTWFEVA